MEENQIKSIDNTPKKSPINNLRPPWKKGQSGNPKGRPKGSPNFSTIFQAAIKKIAKETNIKECEVEIGLVIKAIAEARSGNYQYYKDIFDRRYGQAKQPIGLGLDETISEVKIEIKSNKQDDSKPTSDKGI